MNDLISIIIPVYNVEKYLDTCIDSIVKQSYKNLEIILVDDGSKDSSGKICDNWSKKDDRIHVIHKKNAGVSEARNTGLKYAHGNYIGFLDSDDYIDKNYYKKMLKSIKSGKYDVAVCNVWWVENDNSKRILITGFKDENFENELYKDDSIRGYVWNKLYKKEIVDGLKFDPEIHIWEDMYFNFSLLLNGKVNYIFNDEPLYYYIQRNNSALHDKKNVKQISILDAIDKIIEVLSKTDNSIMLNKLKIQFVLGSYYYIHAFKDIMSEESRAKYYNKARKYLSTGISMKKVGFKDRLKIFCLHYFDFIYTLYFKYKNKDNNY